MINGIIEEMKRFAPQTGFNVVGIDDYSIPGDGEALYMIAHCETVEEAEEIAARHRTSDGDKIAVYPAGMFKKHT